MYSFLWLSGTDFIPCGLCESLVCGWKAGQLSEEPGFVCVSGERNREGVNVSSRLPSF